MLTAETQRRKGTIARWNEGTMERKHDGTRIYADFGCLREVFIATDCDGTMARWHDSTMEESTKARWGEGTWITQMIVIGSQKPEDWSQIRFYFMNVCFTAYFPLRSSI